MSLQGSFQLLLRMPKCDINRQPLLLYFILYLFVIRSFDNLYLARFHNLQCSLMTFRCYPCVSRLNTSYTGSLCCLSNRFGYRWSTRLSNAFGIIYSGESSSSVIRFASASDAANFISSLISFALTSNAPRKIPGKQVRC